MYTSQELATIQAYDNTADTWPQQHDDKNFWENEMARFHELLPTGRILEIGSGGGRDARLLAELGYDYLGTDISRGLLKQAKDNNPELTFEEMSVYDLDFDNKFDGFWASAVLLHIPKEKINEALDSLRGSLAKRAVGFIAIKDGKGTVMEPMDSESNNERLFVYWKDRDFREALARSAFEVVNFDYRPMSERTKWLTYLVKAI